MLVYRASNWIKRLKRNRNRECVEKMINTTMKINKTKKNYTALMNETAISNNHLLVTNTQECGSSVSNATVLNKLKARGKGLRKRCSVKMA